MPAFRGIGVRPYFTYLVVTALLISGCRALTRPAALPNKNRIQVDQLVFNSNFVLASDHRLVRELTAERDDICQTLSLPCGTEPIEVYLFNDAETYRQFLLEHFPSVPSRRAFFLETDTRLCVYAHWGDRVAEDLRHEVSHGYLHAVAPGLPLWLDEGLAEFFEVPRGQAGLNWPHVELLADMMHHDGWQPNLKELELLTDAGQMDQRHYAEAWAWVYFLLNSDSQSRELLISYIADLRALGRVEPLSVRLSAKHSEPERTLAEYLTELKRDIVAQKSNETQIAK
jgi:Protein of unknown function (DUF1570)